jgi:hypothetical protein
MERAHWEDTTLKGDRSGLKNGHPYNRKMRHRGNGILSGTSISTELSPVVGSGNRRARLYLSYRRRANSVQSDYVHCGVGRLLQYLQAIEARTREKRVLQMCTHRLDSSSEK